MCISRKIGDIKLGELNHLQTRARHSPFAAVGVVHKGEKKVDDVTTLTHAEPVRLDPDRLSALYRQMGEANADDVICRAVEELAVRLANCEQHWRARDWGVLRKNVRSLVAISDQVGMTKLSHVAQDVTHAIDNNDAVATAATLTRLLRVGERSLTAVWDLQDLSI